MKQHKHIIAFTKNSVSHYYTWKAAEEAFDKKEIDLSFYLRTIRCSNNQSKETIENFLQSTSHEEVIHE